MLLNPRFAAGIPIRNTVLQQIPGNEFELLRPHLEFIPLQVETVLEHEFQPLHAVYFVNDGIVAKVVEMADGRSVEVGIAGREQMAGTQLAVGLETLMHSLVVLVPGAAFRLHTAKLQELLPSVPQLNRILSRRLGIESIQFARNAACHRLHSSKQRLARWLLLTLDRLESHSFHITHEFLAKLVGTDRPTITLTLAEFQRAGILANVRGIIDLLDRSLLEAQSCECYSVMTKFYLELGLVPENKAL